MVRSRNLVNQLRHCNNFSYEELAAKLKEAGVSISSGMLRQISSGRKPASPSTLYQLAIAVRTAGYVDEDVNTIIAEGDPGNSESLNWLDFPATQYQELGNQLAAINKAEKLAQRHAVLRLEKALLDLLPWDWTDAELLYIVLALLERMPTDRTGGGAVNPGILPIRRPQDSIDTTVFVSVEVG